MYSCAVCVPTPAPAMGTNFTQEITRSGDTICAQDSMASLPLAGWTVTSHSSSANGDEYLDVPKWTAPLYGYSVCV